MSKNKSYKGKKKSSRKVESLDSMDYEEEGFIEGDINIGTPIAAFNFGGEINTELVKEPVHNKIIKKESVTKNSPGQIIKSSPRGITPPIEGEEFTIKRCYQYRPSTVRKLNELKAQHRDVNAYLNTIIDEAIVFYYNHIFYGDEKLNSNN